MSLQEMQQGFTAFSSALGSLTPAPMTEYQKESLLLQKARDARDEHLFAQTHEQNRLTLDTQKTTAAQTKLNTILNSQVATFVDDPEFLQLPSAEQVRYVTENLVQDDWTPVMREVYMKNPQGAVTNAVVRNLKTNTAYDEQRGAAYSARLKDMINPVMEAIVTYSHSETPENRGANLEALAKKAQNFVDAFDGAGIKTEVKPTEDGQLLITAYTRNPVSGKTTPSGEERKVTVEQFYKQVRKNLSDEALREGAYKKQFQAEQDRLKFNEKSLAAPQRVYENGQIVGEAYPSKQLNGDIHIVYAPYTTGTGAEVSLGTPVEFAPGEWDNYAHKNNYTKVDIVKMRQHNNVVTQYVREVEQNGGWVTPTQKNLAINALAAGMPKERLATILTTNYTDENAFHKQIGEKAAAVLKKHKPQITELHKAVSGIPGANEALRKTISMALHFNNASPEQLDASLQAGFAIYDQYVEMSNNPKNPQRLQIEADKQSLEEWLFAAVEGRLGAAAIIKPADAGGDKDFQIDGGGNNTDGGNSAVAKLKFNFGGISQAKGGAENESGDVSGSPLERAKSALKDHFQTGVSTALNTVSYDPKHPLKYIDKQIAAIKKLESKLKDDLLKSTNYRGDADLRKFLRTLTRQAVTEAKAAARTTDAEIKAGHKKTRAARQDAAREAFTTKLGGNSTKK